MLIRSLTIKRAKITIFFKIETLFAVKSVIYIANCQMRPAMPLVGKTNRQYA